MQQPKMGPRSVLTSTMEKIILLNSIVTLLLILPHASLVHSYSKVRRSGLGSINQGNDVITQRSPTIFSMTRPEDLKNDSSIDRIFEEMSDAVRLVNDDPEDPKVRKIEGELLNYVDETLSRDNYVIFDGVKIEPVESMMKSDVNFTKNGSPRSGRKLPESFDRIVIEKFSKYAKNHVMSVNLPATARFFGFKCKFFTFIASRHT
jgi:hypothetical protein